MTIAVVPPAPPFIRELPPQDLLRIARPISEALNGSIIDLVETLEGPALAIKPPGNGLPVSDGY
jgi:hypothetical protein